MMQLIIVFSGLLIVLLAEINASQLNAKPNIVIIMADDMGHNDVSFNGMNQFLTPNIDALAFHGTILDKFYVPPMCTPSRAALMTGKYPLRSGMQHFVIANDQPWGLCPSEKIMPKYFQEAGYSTNLIGKWHLGFFKKAFTPTERGFDYHYGYMGGYIDYYDHSLIMLNKNYDRGHDFYRNLEQFYEGNGTYATDLLTNEAVRVINDHNSKKKPLFLMVNHLAPHTGNENNPMQAPQSEIDKFRYIQDKKRRTYAAMVSKLDESVGRIMEALENTNLLCNTIVVFYCDNGAPTIGLHSNSGSNYPFKGQKNSPWDGAVRVPAIIYTPLWKRQSNVSPQVMHVTDLLPTLAAAAGIRLTVGDCGAQSKLDGLNLWQTLQNNHKIVGRRIVHNIDDIFGYASYMRGPWKYINGTTAQGSTDLWLGEIGTEQDPRSLNYEQTVLDSMVAQVLVKNTIRKCRNLKLDYRTIQTLRRQTAVRCPKFNIFDQMPEMKCQPLVAPCLFNLDIDPCERYNFAATKRTFVGYMESDIAAFRRNSIEPVNQESDPSSNPKFHAGTWTWWQDNLSDNNNGIPGTYCKSDI